jgi:hypothetical protein
MINVFYILPILFIFMNVYHMLKNKQLDKRFRERDIIGMSRLDIIYYFTKISYWIWVPIGFFTNQPELFYVLFVLGFLKFPTYHFNKNIFRIYNDIYPIFSISTLITIFFHWLF